MGKRLAEMAAIFGVVAVIIIVPLAVSAFLHWIGFSL